MRPLLYQDDMKSKFLCKAGGEKTRPALAIYVYSLSSASFQSAIPKPNPPKQKMITSMITSQTQLLSKMLFAQPILDTSKNVMTRRWA
jgi:hypothetical protein